MKVDKDGIAKDLRWIGSVCRVLLGGFPAGRSTARKWPGFLSIRTKRQYSIHIQRPDHTRLRLLIRKPGVQSHKGPGVLWIHGGGYASGAPELMAVSMARIIARECVVVSPDYRLSAEKPYPAALEDCRLALEWLASHAGELGVREDQLFVGGESAGGGLAVALCLYARDHGDIAIACQMPLYPMIDDRMQTRSMMDNDSPVWDERKTRIAWQMYLAVCDPQAIPKYAAPAREIDYAGLPPAITFVGSIEPFCDETVQYVNNLEKAGVPVEFRLFDGCFHAFDMLAPWSRPAKAAVAFFTDCFRVACSSYFAPQKAQKEPHPNGDRVQ